MSFRGFGHKKINNTYTFNDDHESDRGGNDEYYEVYCHYCHEKTEHDVCTDECVNCGG